VTTAKQYTAANGTVYTDDDIAKWAQEAESGFPSATFGPSVPGRPITVGPDAKPFTLRLDAHRRAKLDRLAQERHTTASQLVRTLIDTL
jgi:hypothetical protein